MHVGVVAHVCTVQRAGARTTDGAWTAFSVIDCGRRGGTPGAEGPRAALARGRVARAAALAASRWRNAAASCHVRTRRGSWRLGGKRARPLLFVSRAVIVSELDVALFGPQRSVCHSCVERGRRQRDAGCRHAVRFFFAREQMLRATASTTTTTRRPTSSCRAGTSCTRALARGVSSYPLNARGGTRRRERCSRRSACSRGAWLGLQAPTLRARPRETARARPSSRRGRRLGDGRQAHGRSIDAALRRLVEHGRQSAARLHVARCTVGTTRSPATALTMRRRKVRIHARNDAGSDSIAPRGGALARARCR